ncbi:sodium:calcium antiporter [Minwuia thermotolerans]|uniref:Cation transporter n=1 Tax=Minwuia thermotolerans TaxID=2056226 RepID=A0A2M9FVJ1_9PROT|nr:cation transporter [Minwuia thermotolerans]PJK27485.1 cation transporter [Minwuia thermotolerans]
MIDLAGLSVPLILTAFAAAGIVVLLAGARLTRLADRFADVSGIGEALTGAVFLGLITSLSGSVTSVWTAATGHPELSLSNALGGITAQTAFLVVADLSYRRANLEHAAASLPTMVSGAVLIVLLTMLLAAEALPPVSILGVHPVTPLLLIVYGLGMRIAAEAGARPMWGPAQTALTNLDEPDEPERGGESVLRLGGWILLLGALVGVAGLLIAEAGIAMVEKAGVREGVVGALMTAIATSTPELVTTVAAVRRGALTLAVSGILGGNAFDVLFAAFSDVAYRPGSIYHAMAQDQRLIVLVAILMTAVLLIGMLRRERYGLANVGFESVTMLGLYVASVAALIWLF